MARESGALAAASDICNAPRRCGRPRVCGAHRAEAGVEKENTGYDGDSASLMRAPKSADVILMHMKKEVDSARGFLREVSSGRAGNDGPYFSPCRAKGAGDVNSIKNHPIYLANVSPDEEYEMLLSSASHKKTRQEPAKEAALQRTVNLKLRQATQELLNKRNALAEKLCRLDDSFGEKEKSYKAQVHSFTQQIKKEQASRVRAESQAETYKTAAETQTSHLQAIARERDALLLRLQQAHAELAGRASMEKDTLIQLGALASSVNEDLVFAVQELQQALQGAQDGLHGLEEREAQVRQELQDVDAKYKEDVGLLRMQMDEMCEAREEELQRAELQMGELRQLLQTQEAEARTHVAELQGRLEEQARGLEEREIELKDMAAQLQESQVCVYVCVCVCVITNTHTYTHTYTGASRGQVGRAWRVQGAAGGQGAGDVLPPGAYRSPARPPDC